MMPDDTTYLQFVYQEDLYVFEDQSPDYELPVTVEEKPAENKMPIQSEVFEPEPVHYWGGNQMRILILIKDQESDLIHPKDQDFLMRIVEGGLKYSRQDIAVVNCSKYEYSQIFDEIDHAFLIAFGDHPQKFTGAMPKYEVFLHNGKKVLLSDSLNDLEPDKEKKKALWKALQQMFDINR